MDAPTVTEGTPATTTLDGQDIEDAITAMNRERSIRTALALVMVAAILVALFGMMLLIGSGVPAPGHHPAGVPLAPAGG